MKRYTIGLITGILLTASCVMFMGAKDNEVGRYVRYFREDTNIGWDILDTQTGIMTVRFIDTGEGMSHDIINGKIRKMEPGKDWSEWKVYDPKDKE